MAKKQVKNISLCVLFVLLLLVIMLVSGWSILPAFADTEQYTGALEDLQKDKNFDTSTYPDNETDYEKSVFAEKIKSFYSIHLFQIAESTDGELFVYTYQPSQKTTELIATEINMSLSQSVNGTKLYGLTFLNNDGVFCKYKVNDLIVNDEITRYYNITSIYREWQKGIDEETGNDNIKNAVSFKVGKCFIAETENDIITYTYEQKDTVEIRDPFADFLEYYNGYHLVNYNACRSHYVAFSTDKQIDTLQEVTVAYDWETFSQSGLSGWKSSGVHHEEKTIQGEQKGENTADGWFAKKYEWKRIQSVKDFIKNEDLKDETIKNLDGKQWVLRFWETELVVNINSGIFGSNKHTDVSNVTILRLKFITNGRLYNLGAVSDKVTEDDIPGNNNTYEFDSFSFWQYVWRCIVKLFKGIADFLETVVAVFAIFVVVALLPVLLFVFSLVSPAFKDVLKNIFKYIWKGIKCFFIGLWWLISAPFRLITKLVAGKR